MSAHATQPAAPDAILKDIASKLPVRANGPKRTLWMICMAIGLAAFIFLLVSEPKRAWGAYTVNALYWLGITFGGMVLACAIRMSNGRWAGPIMRIAESLSAFIPWGVGLMVILLVAGSRTYLPWATHVLPRQAAYLNLPFLYARTLIGLGILSWLSRYLVQISLRTDAYLLRNHVAPELKPQYEKLAAGWRGGDPASGLRASSKLSMRRRAARCQS